MTPFEQALADIRAIPSAEAPQAAPAPRSAEGCCTGTRNGYQHHINSKTPPCHEAREANRLWHAAYRQTRRPRTPA